MGQVTKLPRQATEGDQRALDAVPPIVEKELHARAAHMMRAERPDHIPQPTALVHEAYPRLVDKKPIGDADRGHFLAVATKEMREVLRNHARDRRARKRGGDRARGSTVDGGRILGAVSGSILPVQRALPEFSCFSRNPGSGVVDQEAPKRLEG